MVVLAFSVFGIIFTALCSLLLIRFRNNRTKQSQPTAQAAIGKGARVYRRIPPKGQGAITVTIGGRLMEFNARSHDGTGIPSFTPVHIIDAIDKQTVSVAPFTLVNVP